MFQGFLSHGRSNQLVISYPPIHNLRQNGTESAEVIRLALIVAEGLLIKIPEQMERGNADVSSFEATLQEAPKVFQSVRVRLPIHVFNGMVNHLMKEITVKPVIGSQRIGVQSSASLNMTLDQSLKRSLSPVGYYRGLHWATALEESHSHCFVFPARTGNRFVALCLVHIPRFAADEGFVNFYLTVKFHERARLHCEPKAVEHKPSRLLCDTKMTANLIGTDSVFAVHDQPKSR
jgi:hypothetical protein